jgi:hypothetical protein
LKYLLNKQEYNVIIEYIPEINEELIKDNNEDIEFEEFIDDNKDKTKYKKNESIIL